MKKTLHVCIIDEHNNGEPIALLLRDEFPEFEIDFRTDSIHHAYDYLCKNSPDLLFVDLLKADKTAVEMLSKFRDTLSSIIFITDSETNAIQAIKRGVTDCLIKPVKNLDFVITVNKVIENVKKQRAALLSNAVHNKINLPTLQGFKRVNIDEIIRCEADSNYTSIYLSDKSKVMVSKTLYDFEKHLSEYNFFRIHHKHLINLEHLKEYIKGKGGQVIMADNSVLDVSIRKKHEFLHAIA
jgi:two-component system LytT family response regulator